MTAEIHALPLRLAACLKWCYLLRERGEPLSAQAVRTLLEAREPNKQLSGSVVTHLFEQLQKLGYVSHIRYHGVVFTEAGERAAAELVRHHRLLELFLVRVLGVSLDQVDAEAERLEFVLSEEIEERIDALLNHPSEDPHGDPIPDLQGHVHVAPASLLTEIAIGRLVAIQRIIPIDPAFVRYVEALGLVPGAVVRLEARTPYGDVLTLGIGETHLPIGERVATQLLVRVIPEKPVDY